MIAALRLDLDDLGAQVAQDDADRRAHDHVGEFNDLEAGQRPRGEVVGGGGVHGELCPVFGRRLERLRSTAANQMIYTYIN
ncbi:hypothetical protein D3C85_1810190 [compost metagenome]